MGRASAAKKLKAIKSPRLKLDLGCGPNVRDGFEGADQYGFDGKVKHILDLRKPWPWKEASVLDAHSSHFIEHLTALERVHFWNELYRVLVPGGTCQIIVPHWNSCRAYGDPTHQWPPVSEFTWLYLDRPWRLANAPHTDAAHLPGGFACDFEWSYGYAMRQDLMVRNQEYQQFALQNYKEVALDFVATVKKRSPV